MGLIAVPKVFSPLGDVFAEDWNINFLTITNFLSGFTFNYEAVIKTNSANTVLELNQKNGGVIFSLALNNIEKLKVNNSGSLVSLLITGLPPFVVASTTKVSNLNVDRWDDLLSSAILLLSGGILTGYLVTHANPVNNMHLANKQYADSKSPTFLPSGTKLIFGNDPPAGWTRQNAAEDKLLKLSKAAEVIGNAGGDWFIQGIISGSFALSANHLPSHSHSFTYSQTMPVVTITGGGVPIITGFPGAVVNSVGNTGSGNSHAHGWNHDGNWRPRYEIWASAQKD